MKVFLATMIMIMFSAGSPVRAEVIFADNFQDGQTHRWQAMGRGDVRLSEYNRNISLYLSGQVAVISSFSTKGYDKVSVSLSFAAKSLEQGQYCLAEVSADRGKSWHEVNRVGKGQDDAVTLHAGSATVPELNDRNKIYLRARLTGNNSHGGCWLDNVMVSASKISLSRDDSSPFPAARLIAGQSYPRPVDMAFFAPSKRALAAIYHFAGRLTFTGKATLKGFRIVKDSFHYGADKAGSLPDFNIAFTSSGNDIIPERRGIILTAHPMWDLVLEPGTIWNEPGETTFSRAAIPFTLLEKNENCAHNGVMTFLFNNNGIRSDVAVQISSETCQYFKFDLWGFHKADYSPGPLKNGAKIIAAYQKEKSSRLPVRPIAELARDYPGANPADFGAASEVSPADMTAYGLLVDGIHYVGGCDTRYGKYPYCDVLDLPSYSTAKSIFAGLALMRMEKLYPGIAAEKIAKYVPACKKAGGWADVSFQNVLDMTTGHYNSKKYMADEDGSRMAGFFNAVTHQQKITIACAAFNRKARPGRKWVYHTSDSYILGTALQNYLTARQGARADIYRDILVGPLWHSLGLSPVMKSTRRTADRRAQPFTGYGLIYHRDDVIRIAALLNAATIPAFFDRAELDKALQHNPQARGMAAYGRDITYKNGFWARNFQKTLGCDHPLWIPFMSGYGGITIALLPGGMIYYYFSDNNQFAWKQAVIGAGKIRKLCQ
ncbi:MAG: beta-lactamase family protein [Alphaproteobacteria bacterium]|nr:beta-lactamase family protein [Alphaproteobacteria bacterium]